MDSSRIFIVILRLLYGTRLNTNIWAKMTSRMRRTACSIEVSVVEGSWVGQGYSEQTSRGMNAKRIK